MSNTERYYKRGIHEYRGKPSALTLFIGFIFWLLLAVYCVYNIIDVYNAKGYLDVSRFSYFLYETGGKYLLYFYYAIIPIVFVLAVLKLLYNFLKNKSMQFWKQVEPIEYSGEVPKTKSIFSLLFLIFICTGMGYLILKLVPYAWDEFTDYEQTGKEIKNHWAIWSLYDIGGKWLVCSVWGLFGGLMMYGGFVFLKQLFKTLTNKK